MICGPKVVLSPMPRKQPSWCSSSCLSPTLLPVVRLPPSHYSFFISPIFKCFLIPRPTRRISYSDFHCSTLLERISLTSNSYRIFVILLKWPKFVLPSMTLACPSMTVAAILTSLHPPYDNIFEIRISPYILNIEVFNQSLLNIRIKPGERDQQVSIESIHDPFFWTD